MGRGGVTGEDVCWDHTMSSYKELIKKFQINHQYGAKWYEYVVGAYSYRSSEQLWL